MSEVIAIIVFAVVILAIMTEKVHRTAAALVGAVLLLMTHVLTVDKAVGYIDFNTIGVLIGMMVFVAIVKNSAYLSIFPSKRQRSHTVIHGRSWCCSCFVQRSCRLSWIT